MVLALGSAVLLIWVVLERDDSSPRDSASRRDGDITEAAVRSGSGTGPVGVSAKGLRTLAGAFEQPIYWAGARPGYRYSLRQTADGDFYVRYLPPGVDVGERQRQLLIVATYLEPNAYTELQRRVRQEGGFTIALPRGALAYYPEQTSNSVYLAYPGVQYQVEVFDPSPQQARRLIISGRIVPVR
jgi:hypothetical protein